MSDSTPFPLVLLAVIAVAGLVALEFVRPIFGAYSGAGLRVDMSGLTLLFVIVGAFGLLFAVVVMKSR